MSFVHLHLHTQFSLLDGAIRLKDLMRRVRELNMSAVAMTDHGNMFGTVAFYKAAVDEGLQPIIGCEVYVAPGDRRDKKRPVRGDDVETAGNCHLILLAMDVEGYRNLCRLVTRGYTEGFYYKPRVDRELLRAYNKGIIALSGCLAGEVNQAIAAGSLDHARAVMEDYRAMFDGRYYIEIQDNQLPQQERANVELVRLAGEMGLPVVGTNDCHYLNHDDARAHEVLLCVQTNKTLTDEKRFRFETDQLFVKGPEDLQQAFAAYPGAVDNTLDIARRCRLELEFDKYQFPVFATEQGVTLDDQLDRDARAGLEDRLAVFRKRAEWNEEREAVYRERLDRELNVIKDMGFAGYFLIVADFTNYAKRQGIPVGPGRGSAAGSLVAYALRITDLDPLPYNLLFERFLNPERKSMPDIDMDFCYERREEVIRYVREKYGEDHVAQIITFGTLKGKAAIKDVGRALGFSFAETDRIAKLYPQPKQGKDYPLARALQMEPRLREVRDRGEREEKLFEYALRLEGLLRHSSKHAAGIVIGSRPLVEDLPLFMDKDGAIMTQFPWEDVAAIGLIKFDFLGLKTLSLIDGVVRRIRESRDASLDVGALPLDDRATYRLIGKADTVGVFQMESSGMRKLLTQLRPGTFEDIIAVLALFRPGPLGSGMVKEFIKRKLGKVPVRYAHPALKAILSGTYGVIVYQEQVMQIGQVLGGYSLGDADMLRRAMGKKDAEKMAQERQRFLEGARREGVPAGQAKEIFSQMEKFAEYGFNKSHSAAYALISYQTAYLKAHYPEEFLAGLLTLEMGDTDKTFKNIAACRERGIPILPPDVNESREDFTVVARRSGKTRRAIRFGLGAVKGVGAKAIEAILAVREGEEGAFSSLTDFCLRTHGPQVNKKVVESLIKCGAFDFSGVKRRPLIAGLDRTMSWAGAEAEARASNQLGLFTSGTGQMPEPPLPDVAPWSKKETLRAEREALGFYITAHPLDKFSSLLARFTDATIAQARSRTEGGKIGVGGVIQGLKLRNSRKGERYGSFTLEDKTGTIDVICWPKTYRRHEELLATDEPVRVAGMLEAGEDRCQIMADEIVPLAAACERAAREVHFAARAARLDEVRLRALRDTLRKYRGNCHAFLHVLLADRSETVIALSDSLRVEPTEAMIDAVEALLGAGSTSLQ